MSHAKSHLQRIGLQQKRVALATVNYRRLLWSSCR